MFVQDFEVIDRRYDEVVGSLATGTDAVLGGAMDSARAEGERLRVKVGPASWPAPLAKTVEIHPGPIRAHADSTLVAFSWEARGGASLFPHLDADLEIAPFGTDQTQLALRGRYEPPGGTLGQHADQLLLHRVAESTIRAFLASVCAALGSNAVRPRPAPLGGVQEGSSGPGGSGR